MSMKFWLVLIFGAASVICFTGMIYALAGQVAIAICEMGLGMLVGGIGFAIKRIHHNVV